MFSQKKNVFYKKKKFFIGFIISLLILSLFVYRLSISSISESKVLSIPQGYTLSQIAEILEEEGLISSRYPLLVLSRLNPLELKSGDYSFDSGSYSIFDVINRLSRADYGDVYLSITIPEGSNRNEIAKILSRSPLAINEEDFLSLSEGKEGYLFPDTYFFLPSDSAREVVDVLFTTFFEKTKELQTKIQGSSKSFEEIVIMASLIEKESTSNIQEMRTISGILWKRIDQGIPLQVDAPFLFSQGKTSEQLRISDLRKDSPYNTYTNKGLTPGPIANPGINALLAAINPIDSLYFFYLHDNNGNIHYGITHDDHVRNKQDYLR